MWASALLTLFLFAVASVAKAVDFGPAPTKFTTTSLNGNYEVKFAGCASDNLSVEIVNITDYVLVDATGAKVPYTFVVPTMKDDYVVSLAVGGADDVPDGTYTIQVPAAAFCLAFVNNIVSNAFDVTIVVNGEGSVDPEPGVDPEQPALKSNQVLFTLDDHKSDASLYYRAGDIIESDGAGIMLKFDRTGMENATYSYCYKSSAHYTQFKDCDFTISAPAGVKIEKIEFADGAPMSTVYDLDNFEANGYADGVWTGSAQSVSFSTKVLQIPTYGYDDEDNEYITGYTSQTSGARVSTILVTLDQEVDHIGGGETPDPDPGTGEVDPDPNPGTGEVDPDPNPGTGEEVADNVALFDFSTGVVYSVKGVTLTTQCEWNDYFEALQLYASSTGSAKPATFTAPEGKVITEVRLVESIYSANYGFYYMYANFEEPGWEMDITDDSSEVIVTGCGKSLTITADFTSALVAKAYVTIADEGNIDGINAAQSVIAAQQIYDLAGRRVNALQQGVSIVGGKKVIR